MTALLSLTGVTAFYGAIQALKGVDLEINPGEIVTMIGANGAGKSTLMMTICGKPQARNGQIRFDGIDITAMPTHQIMHLGLAQAPEGRRIFGRMSVHENLLMGAEMARMRNYEKTRELVFTLFPPPQGAADPARRHPFRGRAADVGHRPRADDPAPPADARRAQPGPGPARRAPDLQRHPPAQPGNRPDRAAGRAKTRSRRSA